MDMHPTERDGIETDPVGDRRRETGGPEADREAAQRVAAELLERYRQPPAGRGGPTWVQWRLGASGVVESRPAGGADGLMGCTVATGWAGAAVIATGRLRMMEPSGEPPADLACGLGGGIRLACALSRRGDIGWCMVLPDGSVHRRPPEEGRVLDVLRRSLGLPTPPPPVSTGPLDALLWVGAIEAAATARGRALGWPEAVRLHPSATSPPHWGWETLRTLVASGVEAGFAPLPQEAAWMDEGMFARSVLERLPAPAELMAAVRPHLRPPAHRAMGHALHRLGSGR